MPRNIGLCAVWCTPSERGGGVTGLPVGERRALLPKSHQWLSALFIYLFMSCPGA